MSSLMACHECDLLQKVGPLPDRNFARCARCGAVLAQRKRNSLDRSLALALCGLILFVIANCFPFLAMKSGGLVQETTLISGVNGLFDQEMWIVGTLVLLTTVVLPLFEILGMLYILLPLKLNRVPWKLPLVFRLIQGAHPWAMMEVFMLGILVSIVKLAKMASIVPGTAIFAFGALIFVLAASSACLDPRLVWEKVRFER